MADLSKSFSEVIAEIEKSKADLVVRAAELDKREKTVEEFEKALADKIHNFEVDQEEVEKKLKLIRRDEELTAKEVEINQGLNLKL